MELRHLRYFVAVAESLHFGQAAATLGIAQPSLSHQIRQLEAELETSLLRRTKRRVELTESGRLFLDEAREILARADRAAIIARRVGHSHAQRLRVGFGYCMDQSHLAAVVGDFKAKHPTVQIEAKTFSVPAQFGLLADGRLDVGFVRPPAGELPLNCEVVMRDPLLIALPPKHRLVSKPRIPLSALASEPFILVPRDAVPVFHDAVLKACRAAGFVPHAPHEADQLQMMIGMVAAGAGVALVPAGARKIKQYRLVYRPVKSPSPDPIETALAWRRDDASPLVADFVAAARRVLLRWAATQSH
jgi:DNA-binding transcriptional LysR family regulator